MRDSTVKVVLYPLGNDFLIDVVKNYFLNLCSYLHFEKQISIKDLLSHQICQDVDKSITSPHGNGNF